MHPSATLVPALSAALLLALAGSALAQPQPAPEQPPAPGQPVPGQPQPVPGQLQPAPGQPPPPPTAEAAPSPGQPAPAPAAPMVPSIPGQRGPAIEAAPIAVQPPAPDALPPPQLRRPSALPVERVRGQPIAHAEEPPVRIGDFMDTRLTWTLGDDDILHATGEALPFSQIVSIGDRKQFRLFFDSLNSRFGGRENLTHLALYKKLPAFIHNLDTEASLVLRFDLASLATNSNNLNQVLQDAGTYIRAFCHTDGDPDGKAGVSVTLWPIDTDRFRLGYLYDNSWGGTNAAIKQSIFPRIVGAAPGARIQYETGRYSAFVGLKTATLTQVQQVLTPGTSEVEEVRIRETNFGFLAGASGDILPFLHADVGAGYFQQGKFEQASVAGRPVYTYGASARLVVHAKDAPIPQSIDFLAYRNDPDKPQILFKPETYSPGTTVWSVSLEATHLSQNLKDFETTGVTTEQAARALALQATLKSGYARASLTGIYRDLPFILRNQPSFIPFETIPESDSAFTTDELFFAVAADYFIRAARLTPGLGAGVQLPATFRTTSLDSASAPIDRTVVVREQGFYGILPVNRSAVPIFQARASVKWDISQMLSAVAWAQYVRDNNGTFLEGDPTGTIALRTFVRPDFFGLGTSVQARF